MRRDTPENPRKFYRIAGRQASGSGFALQLDGRTAKTPGGAPLVLPSAALVDLMVAEWSTQEGEIVFDSMPLTRLAFAAIDGVLPAPAGAREAILRYAANDLLCYPAQSPRALVVRQAEIWTPLMAWAQDSLRLAFEIAPGLMHHSQPRATLDRLAAILDEIDPFVLAGLSFGAALFGSTVLALALQRGRLDGAAAFAASRLDEAIQESVWGRDVEAAAREARLLAEAVMLDDWFSALR